MPLRSRRSTRSPSAPPQSTARWVRSRRCAWSGRATEARSLRGGLPARPAAGRARRDPARRQGSLRLRGRAHDLRLADVRRPRPHGRRRGAAARAGRGRGARRQDPDARVRLGHLLGQRADGDEPQPVGPRSHLGRLERRLRGRARDAAGDARARQRHRRLDPRALGALRHGRLQADLRPRQHGRDLAARAHARPSRARWRGRLRTPRSCSRSSRASMPRTRPRSTGRWATSTPRWQTGCRASSSACAPISTSCP